MAKRAKNLTGAMATRLGQGVIAFMLGGFTLGALASLTFTFSTLTVFIANHLAYSPSSLSDSDNNIVVVNHILALLFGTLIQIIPSTAIGAVMVILGLRWIVNIHPSWPVLRTFMLLAIGLSCIVYAVNFGFIFVGDWDHMGLFAQTLAAYAQILSLGLPFSLAWLWSTRNNLSYKGARK